MNSVPSIFTPPPADIPIPEWATTSGLWETDVAEEVWHRQVQRPINDSVTLFQHQVWNGDKVSAYPISLDVDYSEAAEGVAEIQTMLDALDEAIAEVRSIINRTQPIEAPASEPTDDEVQLMVSGDHRASR